jgi:hypothetical protein
MKRQTYIDDVVVKSKKRGDLLNNLKETFDNHRKYKIMLNPKKYVLSVRLHGIRLGDQRKSKESGGHRTIATTSNLKSNLEAVRCDGITQPVYIQIRRTWHAFLQAAT